jgi:wyosine [tRNA(Phe)-imidazoG37] synthetase (radical SAM superfamily)
VLSRRAGGISIGVNLNADKVCNFNCVYCQIDRTTSGEKMAVDFELLAAELRAMVELVVSGRIFRETKFSQTPKAMQRLCDIAISGDGEPTACHNFDRVVDVCASVRPPQVKLVLITNASLLERDSVRRGLEILDANNGQIWAKLDAGTEDYYRQVSRSKVPFQRILDNLLATSLARPIIIQTLLMLVNGRPPSGAELAAYCGRLNDITTGGGIIKQVQIHTIARPPAEQWVAALASSKIDAIATLVEQETGLPVMRVYAGS